MLPQPKQIAPCSECNFELFIPVRALSVSSLGIYNDARFAGRSILSLTPHYDSLEDVPVGAASLFMKDIQDAVKALKAATGSPRINVAIFGNRESHVHAHLIPRYPEKEEFPDCSPWNDKREKTLLSDDDISLLSLRIQACFLDP